MPRDLLELSDSGLYCPLGGFHIDPWRPVPLAVVTHAHSDHARPGSQRYVAAAPGLRVLRRRLGVGATIDATPYRERLNLGSVRVSFHPAGHVLGSSQIRVESGDAVWVVSGDYKRQPDPTCAAFEVVECDVFITEATFAMPVYRWRPAEEIARDILEWWRRNAAEGRNSAIFCYALGKAQRVLGELARLPGHPDAGILVHGAMHGLIEDYRDEGIVLPPTRRVSDDDGRTSEEPAGPSPATAPKSSRRRSRAGQPIGTLVLAPPSAAGSAWMRRFGSSVDTAFVSGWMQVRGIRRRRGYDRGFVLSDHADWDGLLDTIRSTGARRVLATHGYSETLARHLRDQGLDASVLETRFAAEDEE